MGRALPESNAPGLGRPLLAVAIVLLAVVYGSSAMTSGDPLWFVPARLDEPSTITVYQAGSARQLVAGSAEYTSVVGALGDVVRSTESAARAGLSDDTLQTLTRGPGGAVEIHFDRAQRLGGSHARGRPTRMLVALDGPFARDPFVFVGDERGWWAEALVSSRVADLRRALRRTTISRFTRWRKITRYDARTLGHALRLHRHPVLGAERSAGTAVAQWRSGNQACSCPGRPGRHVHAP